MAKTNNHIPEFIRLFVCLVLLLSLAFSATAQESALAQKLLRLSKEQPIITAAKAGNQERIKQLLQAGTSPDIKDRGGWTPLHWAAAQGEVKIAQLLLEAGARRSAKDRREYVPLEVAAMRGQTEIVTALLEYLWSNKLIDRRNIVRKALLRSIQRNNNHIAHLLLTELIEHDYVFDTNDALEMAVKYGNTKLVSDLLDRDTSIEGTIAGRTFMGHATKYGFTAIVRLLLKAGAEPDEFSGYDNWTALHFAAQYGRPEIAQLLIDAGTDVDIRTKTGYSPINLGACQGHTEVTQILLKADASLATNSRRTPPLDCAIHEGHSQVINLIINERPSSVQSTKSTALHMAVEKDKLTIAKQLLAAGAPIKALDIYGETPLDLAIKRGRDSLITLFLENPGQAFAPGVLQSRPTIHQAAATYHHELIRRLLKAGADVNHRDRKERTPLHWAAGRGHEHTVRTLLQLGAAPSLRKKGGATPLFTAVSAGRWETAQILLQHTDSLNQTNAYGQTLLHAAAKGDSPRLIEHFIERGLPVDMPDENGQTPLHNAAHYGKLQAIRSLIAAGAHKDTADNNGRSPLHLALDSRKPEAALLLYTLGAQADKQSKKALKRHPSDRMRTIIKATDAPDVIKTLETFGADFERRNPLGATVLHLAASENRPKTIRALVDLGHPVNAINSNDDTPLHQAALHGNIEAIEALLAAGADPQASNRFGEPPLMTTITHGHLSAAKHLLAAGASPTQRDHRGNTPLHEVATTTFTKGLPLLLQAGAELHAQNHRGQTPLHIAAEAGDADFVTTLLDRGAQPTQPDDDSSRALHYAARGGDLATLNVILNAGAQHDHQNEMGNTPLHWAAEAGHTIAMKRLIEKGTNIYQRNEDYFTPLHEAIRNGNAADTQLLIDAGINVNAVTGTERDKKLARTAPPTLRRSRQALRTNLLYYTFLRALPVRSGKENSPYLDVFRVLCEADVEAPRLSNGYSLLHEAIDNNAAKVVQILLETGANPQVSNHYGDTPLDLARARGNLKIIRLLSSLTNPHD